MSSLVKSKLRNKFSKSLGSEWKRVREHAGLTQNEVAQALGYQNGQFISNIEAGRCRFPGRQLPKIKELYGLKTDEILRLVLEEEETALRSAFQKVFRKA